MKTIRLYNDGENNYCVLEDSLPEGWQIEIETVEDFDLSESEADELEEAGLEKNDNGDIVSYKMVLPFS